MRQIRAAMFLVLVMWTYLHDAQATDRFFSDIVAESPSKRYRVEAKSPDNAGGRGHRAFQGSFVYTCRDTTTKQVLWTRAQTMGEPQRFGGDSAQTFCFPKEGSPVSIFVSDAGWAVIRTSWDELIPVDLEGHDRCRIKLLNEGVTKREKAKYVQNTTAGARWSGYSLWYFLDVGEQPLFVVRPWWGRRIVLNLKTGMLVKETQDISNGAVAHERDYVMAELARGLGTLREHGKLECCKAVRPILTASLLAGRLPVTEAAPLLEELQQATYIGGSTSGGLGSGTRFEGEVNPHSYATYTLRQVAQLSLRRLGGTPLELPANQFNVQFGESRKNHPYAPKPLSVPRADNAGKVETGMKAEQVLDLLGGPDFVGYDTWEYDMDANPPFSLILTWDARSVTKVRKKTPVLWQDGVVRDEQIVR